MLIPLITFAAVLVVALGTYWALIVRPEEQTQRALNRRLRGGKKDVLLQKRAGLLKEQQRLSELPLLERLLGHAMRVSGPLQRMLNQSGLSWTVGTLVLLSGTAALLAYLLTAYYLRAPLVGIPLGLVAAYFPFAYVRYQRKRRLIQFEEQFPEAIDLLARALRAGHAFTTALEMAATELSAPVGAEFRLMYDRQNFGMPVPDTLRDFAERVPMIDAKFFATAVLTQRESGGNLSEVLDNLSSVIRERFKVKRQVRVISAHGRMTGWVLAAMPPCLALALFMLNPKHMMILVNDPLGVQMIAVAITLQVLGTVIIRKLVNIEY
jgi:tight adherence protein B